MAVSMFDANFSLKSVVTKLKQNGVTAVGRYYTKKLDHPKILTKPEATAAKMEATAAVSLDNRIFIPTLLRTPPPQPDG